MKPRMPSVALNKFLMTFANKLRTVWKAPTIVLRMPLKISRIDPTRSPRPLTIADMVKVFYLFEVVSRGFE